MKPSPDKTNIHDKYKTNYKPSSISEFSLAVIKDLGDDGVCPSDN